MVNNIRKQLENEGIEPLLIDIFDDSELNTTIQKHGSLKNVDIEIKISQQGKELFLVRKSQFVTCPCNNQHPRGNCTHTTDANYNAICS